MNRVTLSNLSQKLKKTSDLNSLNTGKNKKNLILIKNILIKNKSLITRSITKDSKKSLIDAENEFKASIEIWKYAINNISKIQEKKKFKFSNKRTGKIIYKPIGLVAFITPWNYPLLTLSERLPFCLAAGCNVLIKTSEYSKNFKNVLIKIFAGNRKITNIMHVLKIVDPTVGNLICNEKKISAISFVGSTETGKKILKQSASSMKKIFLELGGKNCAIVTKKAKLKTAVVKIVNAIFENAGQACVGISRIIIHEDVYDKFLENLVNQIRTQFNKKNKYFQMPANEKQKKKVIYQLKYIKKKYRNEIYKIFNIGSKLFTPILINLKTKNRYFNENEFFFPIVTIEKFKTLTDAVNLSNASPYGLAAYIFSSHQGEINFLTNEINAGRIWHNTSLQWNPSLPVGGFNLSGQDRDMGIQGYYNYLTTKSIYSD
jgi:betaine-aldehyde dehydrogenase|tara:strand:+ start:661 stop:1953 length:1293 start_codon:yes stop_codon:yes gene_type:complete